MVLGKPKAEEKTSMPGVFFMILLTVLVICCKIVDKKGKEVTALAWMVGMRPKSQALAWREMVKGCHHQR